MALDRSGSQSNWEPDPFLLAPSQHSLCWSLFFFLEALGVCSSSGRTVSRRHAVNCSSTFRSALPSLSAAQMQPIFTGWSTRNRFPLAKNSSHSLAFSFWRTLWFSGSAHSLQVREQVLTQGSDRPSVPGSAAPASGTVQERAYGSQLLTARARQQHFYGSYHVLVVPFLTLQEMKHTEFFWNEW